MPLRDCGLGPTATYTSPLINSTSLRQSNLLAVHGPQSQSTAGVATEAKQFGLGVAPPTYATRSERRCSTQVSRPRSTTDFRVSVGQTFVTGRALARASSSSFHDRCVFCLGPMLKFDSLSAKRYGTRSCRRLASEHPLRKRNVKNSVRDHKDTVERVRIRTCLQTWMRLFLWVSVPGPSSFCRRGTYPRDHGRKSRNTAPIQRTALHSWIW